MSDIRNILRQRKSDGLFRALKHEIKSTDFCSNDYLGFARSSSLTEAVFHEVSLGDKRNGATGSRLLSGNTELYTQLERQISEYHSSEDALIYPSGYQANLGLLSCIATKNDTLILDELVHASLIDGARLSHAHRFKFSHNNLNDLCKKLEKGRGTIYVVVESLYSMDGDIPDLKAISELCQKFNAKLIVDEAHSAGIYGPSGAGLVSELGLQNQVFARIITYGKAFGIHGAAILGSSELKDYLVNYSRSFIYSTGLPPYQLVCIKQAYLHMKNAENERKNLFSNIAYFRAKIKSDSRWISSNSPIQSLLISGNKRVHDLAIKLQQLQFEVFPILSPTVASGQERIRFCMHSFNTTEEIDQLFIAINSNIHDL